MIRTPRQRRGRRRVRPGLALVLPLLFAAAAAAGIPGTAATATPSATARLSVDAGDAGVFVAGRPLPVHVEIDTDVLVAGNLVVSLGAASISRPVEVAGGSSQQVEVVVPTPPVQPNLSVHVSLMAGRAELASTNANATAVGDLDVVGILPGLLRDQGVPGAAPLSVDAGTARFVALREQDLEAAPGSFGPLSAIAAGPDDIARLSPGVRQAVLAWTTGGGELLVDAGSSDQVAGLPAGWHPSAGRSMSVGRGEVIFTAGALAAGHWGGQVDPASHDVGAPVNGESSGQPLSFFLGRLAGLGQVHLRWLLTFLALYVLTVGPLCFVLFRRRQRAELLWVVLPLVAVVFAGTAYVIGSAQRSGLRTVHTTVLDTTSGNASAVSYVAVSSPGETTSHLLAPPGWVVGRFDELGSGSQFAATLGTRGMDGSIRLAAGQFAVFEAAGPAGNTGQLLVDARSDQDGIASGTVTNATPYLLKDVTVLVGTAGVDIGALAPAARASWHLSAAAAATKGVPVEATLWPARPGEQQGFGGFGPFPAPKGVVIGGVGAPIGAGSGSAAGASAGPASLTAWSSAPFGLAPGTRGAGVAVAVGWTDQYRPPLTLAGHGPPATGDTAVVGSSVVAPGSAVGDLALVRRVLRGGIRPSGLEGFSIPMSGDQVVVAWSLPPAAAGHTLSLAVPSGLGAVSVWTGTTWRAVADTGTGNGMVGGMPGGPVVFVPPPPALPTPPPAGTPGDSGGSGPFVTAAPFGPPTTAVTIVPFPGVGAGAATTVALPLAASASGTVVVRLGTFHQPIALDQLALRVLP